MQIKRILGSKYCIKALSLLYRLDNWIAQKLPESVKSIGHALERPMRLRRMIYCGASKGLCLRRTGNIRRDWMNYIFFKTCYWLDKLDTILFYRQKKIQAKFGRVRSHGEKAIADYLWDHKIKFFYEYPVVVGKHCFEPDFFLPEMNVFVEFYGMMNDDEYRKRHDMKERRYRENKIPVIAVYPYHLRRLDEVIGLEAKET